VYYICINKQTHTVMKILVSIIFFLSFFGFTQSLIDVKSIESNLWDLNTKKRISLGYDVRQLCDVSKKASDMQVDYLKQNGLVSHESNIKVKNKVLTDATQRFDYFNKDSVKTKNSSGKIAPKSFAAEVVSYRTNYYAKDTNINFKIAQDIYNGFSNSKRHNYILNEPLYNNNFNKGGNFSVRVVVLREDENTYHLEIYCVGVFCDIYKLNN
jgi:hypothetical protein